MDEEEAVLTPSTPSMPSTPSTTSVSPPQSPPMRGTKARPPNGTSHSSNRVTKMPSVFKREGIDAFLYLYCRNNRVRREHTPNPLIPTLPMERYENGNEDVPWQLSDTLASDVAAESGEERERKRERRLSNVVDDVHKVFNETNEPRTHTSSSQSSATIEAEGSDAEDAIPTTETKESPVRDLMAHHQANQAKRQKKMLSKGISYKPIRQRKIEKKGDGASGSAESLGEVGLERGKKRKGKENFVVSGMGDYDKSLRLRRFSVSDEEEKRAKMVKVGDRRV